jgi:hypothetical protein
MRGGGWWGRIGLLDDVLGDFGRGKGRMVWMGEERLLRTVGNQDALEDRLMGWSYLEV